MKVKFLNDNALLPSYATEGSAGMDIRSCESGLIRPFETKKFHTGIAVAVPEGTELQVRSRSGLASKGIVVANSPGTIDSDYRGEICVLLHNNNSEDYYVLEGDRIAQLVLAPYIKATLEEVNELDETDRGAAGFGSTGRN